MKSLVTLAILLTASSSFAQDHESKAAKQLNVYTDLVYYAEYPAPDCVLTSMPKTADQYKNQTSSQLSFADVREGAPAKQASVVVGSTSIMLTYRPDLSLSSDFVAEPRGMIKVETRENGNLVSKSYVQLGKFRVEIGDKVIVCVK